VAPVNLGSAEAAHVLAAYDALGDVDVIHDHTTLGPLLGALAHPDRPPVVVTQHNPFDAAQRRVLTWSARHAAVVAVSHSHARSAGPVPITAVVPHGIDLCRFRPGTGDGGYLLFIGRMSPDKGAHRAIHVARRCRRPLVLLAKMHDEDERAYFARQVEPLLDDDVTVLFEPGFATRLDLQCGAAALLNPITWPEPFGLVMAEALATATPVIAFAAGAAPEIVEDGRTGYLCHDEDSMVEAVGRLDRIDRAACRRSAEERFAAGRMTRDYVAVYEAVRRRAGQQRRFAEADGPYRPRAARRRLDLPGGRAERMPGRG
jgi:glycosyltransferase involved in cell wall biosynthesis